MDNQIVTIPLPPGLYARLSQRAAAGHRSLADEVMLALSATVSETDDIPADLAATLASMAALDDQTLWQLAGSRVIESDAARLDDLADKRQRLGLTDEESREAEALALLHDRVMVVRAEAVALLKQRGHDVRGLFSGA
jgi:plasmid stability protein